MFFLTLFLGTIAVLLFTHSSADSTAAVGWLSGLAAPLLGKLPADLQALILAPVVAFLFHWVDKAVTALLARVPGLEPVADAVESGGGWVSAVKALAVWALGYFATGLPLTGIVASGLRAAGQAAFTSTPNGLAKAKAVSLILGTLAVLSLAGPGMAATAPAPKEKISLLDRRHFSLSPGAGYRWERSIENAYAVPYWDVQGGYAIDHVKVSGRLGHNVGPIEGGTAFYEARLGLVF